MALVLDFAPAHWSSGLRMVALALADRVNQDYEAWPSLEDLSRRSGICERQVRKHLRQLESEGIIRNCGQRIIGTQAYSNLWIWLWRTDWGAELQFPPGRNSSSLQSLTGGRNSSSPEPSLRTTSRTKRSTA